MNKDIKARWVEALRSGEYKQGRHQLRHAGRYCCLGVLCDIAVRDGVISTFPVGFTHPAAEVRAWADIDISPTVRRADGSAYLVNLNDDGTPFSEIADLIEEQL